MIGTLELVHTFHTKAVFYFKCVHYSDKALLHKYYLYNRLVALTQTLAIICADYSDFSAYVISVFI